MEDEMQLVKVDSGLIVQVVINIIDNAIKYTPVGSRIEINTKKMGNQVRVEITDDGEGIADENKQHVFEMFYTANEKIADSRRSLGLGLALCKSIINAHGGEIYVKNNNPHGSKFQFTIQAEEVAIHD
jgi:two-component system sensor histidine kinase KdpD